MSVRTQRRNASAVRFFAWSFVAMLLIDLVAYVGMRGLTYSGSPSWEGVGKGGAELFGSGFGNLGVAILILALIIGGAVVANGTAKWVPWVTGGIIIFALILGAAGGLSGLLQSGLFGAVVIMAVVTSAVETLIFMRLINHTRNTTLQNWRGRLSAFLAPEPPVPDPGAPVNSSVPDPAVPDPAVPVNPPAASGTTSTTT